MRIHKKITITGKVQGVFFRATAKNVADTIGLSGWVKNMEDGNVCVVISGEKEQVDQFIVWCRKGPDMAEVENVLVEESEEINTGEFVIRRR